jgi:glycosyltransferase involved in cell wall biosynthesis
MRVLHTSEARFERTPDGAIWGAAAYGRAHWSRHLGVFSGVLVAARVADVEQPSSGYVRASGEGICFCPLPPYSGLSGLIGSLGTVKSTMASALRTCPAMILRSPSPVAYLVCRQMLAAGRTYGAQIVGDPDQVFSAGSIRHPLRAPLRRLATAAQRRLSWNAAAALFVTSDVLQRKYPTKGRMYSASDVALDDAAFEVGSSRCRRANGAFTLVTVGTLDQPYKGTAVLLDAVATLRRSGTNVLLRIVGGGRLMPELRRQAEALDLVSAVQFLGQLDQAGVRQALESADLFVLPSLTEGLPRALLEAMAAGLPAVASNVGGIGELLAPEWLVPARDARALAARIQRLAANDEARVGIGDRNRRVARAYHEREQEPVRNAFLLAVRQACAC